MNEEDITAFMVQTVKKKNLKEKAGNALWGVRIRSLQTCPC